MPLKIFQRWVYKKLPFYINILRYCNITIDIYLKFLSVLFLKYFCDKIINVQKKCATQFKKPRQKSKLCVLN